MAQLTATEGSRVSEPPERIALYRYYDADDRPTDHFGDREGVPA